MPGPGLSLLVPPPTHCLCVLTPLCFSPIFLEPPVVVVRCVSCYFHQCGYRVSPASFTRRARRLRCLAWWLARFLSLASKFPFPSRALQAPWQWRQYCELLLLRTFYLGNTSAFLLQYSGSFFIPYKAPSPLHPESVCAPRGGGGL